MRAHSLQMNPHAHVTVLPQPRALPVQADAVELVIVECPVVGRGLLVHELTRESEPVLFEFFARLIDRGGRTEIRSDGTLLPLLRKIGFVVEPSEITDWPRYRVSLGGLIGQRGSVTQEPPCWEPVVAADLLFQEEFSLHPALAWPAEYGQQPGRLECFARGPACWVTNPSNGAVTPFWLDRDVADIVKQLAPGQPPPKLPSPLVASLAATGILVPATDESRVWSQSPESYRVAFEARRFVIVPDLLHPFEVDALRAYCDALVERRLIRFSDEHVQGRFARYNETIARFVHVRLANVICAIVGRPVVPTFSYFFSYEQEAELTPHVDRPEAKYSISLQVDYTPEREAETHWPLCFVLEDGSTAEADLRIGSAVVYHGAELRHFRTPLPRNHRSAHLILEYVPSDFAGPLI